MWTKSEDLQNKYVKLSNQQDYETVTKVLHEFGFEMVEGFENDKYYSTNPILVINSSHYFSYFNSYYFSEIPIQQFYDYLKPKTLKVEDLVEGEIYKSSYDFNWLFKYNKNNNETVYYLTPIVFSKSSWGFYKNSFITPSTSEEKKWLEVCIKQNKFIPKTDLDLYDNVTFELKSLQTISEYYEFVGPPNREFTVGKIYKIRNPNNLEAFGNFINDKGEEDGWSGTNYEKFKPSTKEFFDKQEYLVQYQEAAKPIENKSLVGRYLKYVGTSTNLPKYGDYFQIQKEKSGCNLLRLSDNAPNCSWVYEEVRDGICKNFELMPKSFNPNEVKSEKWIPKVGDWVVSNIDFLTLINHTPSQILNIHNSGKRIHLKEGHFDLKDFRKAEPHEIPNQIPKSNSMSKEELLIEAKRRYPVGTKARCLTGKRIETVKGTPYWDYTRILVACEESINAPTRVYNSDKNEWAEIVSLPQEEDLFDTKEGQEFLAQGKPGLDSTTFTLKLRKDYFIGSDPITNKSKIDDNQVNLVIKQSESIILKRIENEINIKVNNLKTIKI